MALILSRSASCVCHAVADLFLSPSSFTAAAGSPVRDASKHLGTRRRASGCGIATWNIEYRRFDNPGGGWPGTFTDVGDAVDRVRVISREHPIDLSRVVTIGHSAGAHLALWAAARNRLPKDSQVYRDRSAPAAGCRRARRPWRPARLLRSGESHLRCQCGRATNGWKS